MKTYARIQGGIVMEIIPPLTYDINSPEGINPPFSVGDEVPIAARFNSTLISGPVSTMADITSASPQPEQGWATADGKTFYPPSTQAI